MKALPSSPLPARRPLKIFATDPMLGRAAGNRITIDVATEQLEPGPRGSRLAVIDYDGWNQRYYAPVDLNERQQGPPGRASVPGRHHRHRLGRWDCPLRHRQAAPIAKLSAAQRQTAEARFEHQRGFTDECALDDPFLAWCDQAYPKSHMTATGSLAALHRRIVR